MEHNIKAKVGPGIGTILTIVFIILKCCKVIDWSLFWVFSPMLIAWEIIGFLYWVLAKLEAWAEYLGG